MIVNTRVAVTAALIAITSGCIGAPVESGASRQEQEPERTPAAEVQRLCVDPSAGLGRCAPKRESIAGRAVYVRHEAARQLMEMMVRGTKRMLATMDDVDVDLSMIPPRTDDGIAFLGNQSETGDVDLMCYQIETDTLCNLIVDETATATTELFDGATLAADGKLTLDELQTSGNTDQSPNLGAIASYMAAAMAPIGEDGDIVMPADGPLDMTFGHWSCSLRRPAGATTNETLDASCRLSRTTGALPPEPAAAAPAPAPAN